MAIKPFFPMIWQILTLKITGQCHGQCNKCDVKCQNTLGCLDQYMTPNSQNTRGECPQQMEVNALRPLKCRRVPPALKMCYQASMINTSHQIVNILEVSAHTPTHGSKYPLLNAGECPHDLTRATLHPCFV